MPDILYGKSAYNRTRGNLPELPLVNLFAEATPVDRQGVSLQSRKGLMYGEEVGDGPVRQIYRHNGTLNNAIFVVSGSELFCNGVSLGNISGGGPVSMAGNSLELLIAAGGPLYRATLTTLAQVDFPDNRDVVAVVYLASRFVAVTDNAQQFYWSDVLDGLTWDALSFATAEAVPDRINDVVILNDNLVFLGEETVEFWMITGDSEAPFAPFQGMVFQRGVIGPGCTVVEDNTFIWIGEDGIVYRNGQVPEAISDDGIVERVRASTTHSVWLMEDERHKFVCVRLDDCTMAYDLTTRQWCEFASHGRPNFRARCTGFDFLGDDEKGILWRAQGYADNDGPLERRLRGGIALTGGSFSMNNVRVTANTGQTHYVGGDSEPVYLVQVTGGSLTVMTADEDGDTIMVFAPVEEGDPVLYSNPRIEMRVSNDYGQTWSHWEADGLGTKGNYRALPEWRALGMADAPGVLFEWRVTDPVDVRFSGAVINESGGGRSR